MSKYEIEVTKIRWVRKPLARKFTIELDDDFGGYIHIDKKQNVNVKVTEITKHE